MGQRNLLEQHSLETSNSGSRCRIIFLTESFLTVEVYLLPAIGKWEKHLDSETMYSIIILGLKSLETHKVCCQQKRNMQQRHLDRLKAEHWKSCRRTRRPWLLKQNKQTKPQTKHPPIPNPQTKIPPRNPTKKKGTKKPNKKQSTSPTPPKPHQNQTNQPTKFWTKAENYIPYLVLTFLLSFWKDYQE